MTGHRIGIGRAAGRRANIDGMSGTESAPPTPANKGPPANGGPDDEQPSVIRPSRKDTTA
ncbi:hypothetical protein GCM10010424_54080 [Streptomyces lienomycini]